MQAGKHTSSPTVKLCIQKCVRAESLGDQCREMWKKSGKSFVHKVVGHFESTQTICIILAVGMAELIRHYSQIAVTCKDVGSSPTHVKNPLSNLRPDN